MPSRLYRGWLWATIAVVILVALIIAVPTALGLSYQIVRHASCSVGAVAKEERLWTPVTIVDSPTNTSSPAVYAIASGWAPNEKPAFMNVTDGEAEGVFSLDTWALSHVFQDWQWGPGGIQSCSAYQVNDISRLPNGPVSPEETTVILAPPGSASDAGVPDQVNVSTSAGGNYSSVLFFANYNRSQGSPSELTVGGNGTILMSSISEVGGTFFVVVPFVLPSGLAALFPGWMGGVETWLYVFAGPYTGCIEWFNGPSPLGAGLAFGPPIAQGSQTCSESP